MEKILAAGKLLDEILIKTKTFAFSGDTEKDEEDVAAYFKLMEEREPLIKKLHELDIGEETKALPEYKKIKQTIHEITEIDKAHLAYVAEMHDTIKEAYKLVKQGQLIHKGYTALPDDAVSMRFDIKQ